MGLAIARRLSISPVPVLIAIAVSSNLQGAATMVGDTTSMLLGGFAEMNFFDFFWMEGRPGIFWAWNWAHWYLWECCGPVPQGFASRYTPKGTPK